MSIKSDRWIRRMAAEHRMIEPFSPEQVRVSAGHKIVSYGTSSYGYDVRCADEFKIFTNINSTIVDPKNFDEKSFVDFKGPVCIIPPNSFALASTVEFFRIPRSVLTVCLGKCVTGDTRVVDADTGAYVPITEMQWGKRTMACTSGTVSMGGQPALRATRLEAPSAPTTLSACNSLRCPPESTCTRSPRPFAASPRKRVSKESLAPACCALRANAGINRERSMIRSGRASATCAERPSVNSSKRRISLTMLSDAAAPSWVRNWSVTISERDAGSKPGLDSRTRTCRPPPATVAAVYKPAAEPPTTMTSPLFPTGRDLCSVPGTISLSQVARTPLTVKRPSIHAQISQEYGLLSARPEEACTENG